MKFEKVSLKQYAESAYNAGHTGDYEKEYESLELPKRGTTHSAGYDFRIPYEVTLNPGESAKVPSGIRATGMPPDCVLMIFPRSSSGIKKGLNFLNGTGIIDSDYQNAENEGNITLAFRNTSDKTQTFEAGERIAQGIFVRYNIVEDDDATNQRIGGIGSTGK